MKLDVNEICRHNRPSLKQLIVSNDCATISSGDLSEREQYELALQLIECASELVSQGFFDDLSDEIDEIAEAIRDSIVIKENQQ